MLANAAFAGAYPGVCLVGCPQPLHTGFLPVKQLLSNQDSPATCSAQPPRQCHCHRQPRDPRQRLTLPPDAAAIPAALVVLWRGTRRSVRNGIAAAFVASMWLPTLIGFSSISSGGFPSIPPNSSLYKSLISIFFDIIPGIPLANGQRRCTCSEQHISDRARFWFSLLALTHSRRYLQISAQMSGFFLLRILATVYKD